MGKNQELIERFGVFNKGKSMFFSDFDKGLSHRPSFFLS